MSLQTTERETYEEMWAVDAYREAGSPGVFCAPIFAQVADPSARVLDIGCGLGHGGAALEALGFTVCYADMSKANPEMSDDRFQAACLWSAHDMRQRLNRLRPIDYVYCCDVLEHLPPTFVMLAVQHCLDLALKGCFFSIALVSDHMGVWVGKSLHQTVQPFTVWRDQLKEIGRVTDARDLGPVGLFFVEPL